MKPRISRDTAIVLETIFVTVSAAIAVACAWEHQGALVLGAAFVMCVGLAFVQWFARAQAAHLKAAQAQLEEYRQILDDAEPFLTDACVGVGVPISTQRPYPHH